MGVDLRQKALDVGGKRLVPVRWVASGDARGHLSCKGGRGSQGVRHARRRNGFGDSHENGLLNFGPTLGREMLVQGS